MPVLYITNQLKIDNLKINKTDYVYSLTSLNNTSNYQIINNTKKIDNYAIKIKNEYIDYINSLNKFFLEYKLIYDDSISMFFFSDLFNKRTERFKTYISICHILYLKDFLDSNNNIKKIITIGCSPEFNSAITSIVNNIKIEKYSPQKGANSIFKFYLSQFLFFFNSIIKLLLIKTYYKKKLHKSVGTLFLSRYPLHFNKDFVEDKYADLIKGDDMYLISLITDGIHQNIKLKDIKKHTKRLNNENNIILLDSYLKINDFIKGFLNYLYLSIKIKFSSTLLRFI